MERMERIVGMYCAATVWPAHSVEPPAFSKVCGHLGKLSRRFGALFDK